MRTSIRYVAPTLALGVGLVVVSCDKSPTRPSVQPSSVPPPVTVVDVEVVAPESIAPGTSAQLTANAVKSDGSVENVTSKATWHSSCPDPPCVLQVDAAGVATARAPGEAAVSARYLRRSSIPRRVLVLPSGTYRLSGLVTDSGIPLEGVTIQVIEGTGKGLSAVTDPVGTYNLYGVSGEVRLQAMKEGYANRLAEVQVAEHMALNIEMEFEGKRDNLSGTYTLNLVAGACTSTTLPDQAKSRSYTAAVVQAGPQLRVQLSGADFIVTGGRGDHFGGSVSGDGAVTFAIGDAYYYYYYYESGQFDVVERFDAATALIVQGTVNAQSSPTGISGSLRGVMALTAHVSAPFWPFTTACYSNEHRFEMRRQ